jgi:hypothetical protein
MLLWEALQLMTEAKDDPLISVLVDQINAIEVVPYSDTIYGQVKNKFAVKLPIDIILDEVSYCIRPSSSTNQDGQFKYSGA